MSVIRPAPYRPGPGLQDGEQMNLEAAAPSYSIETGVVGEGNNAATAYPLDFTVSLIESGADGTGVRLPFPKPGWSVDVINRSGSSKIVYAHQSDLIDGSASMSLGDGEQVHLYCTGEDWIANGGPSAGSIVGLPVVTLTSSNNPGPSNYTGLETVPMVWNGALVQITLDNLALILSNYPYGNIASTSPFDAPVDSNGDGTEVYFNAGSGDGTGQAAGFYAYGGNAGTAGDGNGGNAELFGGGSGSGTGFGGAVVIGAGQANGTGTGGAINLTAGGSLNGGNGGGILIASGTSNNVSGQVLVQSNNTSNAQSGDVLFGSGNDVGNGLTGLTTVKSGDSTSGNSGDLKLATGSAGGTRGNITLDGHRVVLPGLPTADPHVVGALWNSSGVLHISAG